MLASHVSAIVGNNHNVQALIGDWIPYNGRATGVPPVTVPGLDQSTEEPP